MSLDKLISGHKKFRNTYENERGDWDALVRQGQHPKVLWIGCSDSRVTPELITGARPGDMLVFRNVANVVPPYGTSGDATFAVLEFAVIELGVEHIVVCGHTFCGGVQAVLSQARSSSLSSVARWVSWIRPALSQVEASGVSEEELYPETIKANILLQRDNVISYPRVSQAIRSGHLNVHGWLFSLETGSLAAFDESTNQWRELCPPAEV